MLNNNNRATANLAMLEFIASKLGPLNDKFVFLGGCTTALFITDSASPDIRPTLDVDCIVEVISLAKYHKLEKELGIQGFKKSIEDDIICRWRYDDMILDVMPTDEKILGFGNRWYKSAIANSISHKLSSNLSISSVTAPYFLATKLEAFKTRGENNFLASHDLEDIITVLDGRIEIADEIKFTDMELKLYLIKTFSEMLNNSQFISSLPGHLNYGSLTTDRAQIVLNRIKNIANIDKD